MGDMRPTLCGAAGLTSGSWRQSPPRVWLPRTRWYTPSAMQENEPPPVATTYPSRRITASKRRPDRFLLRRLISVQVTSMSREAGDQPTLRCCGRTDI